MSEFTEALDTFFNERSSVNFQEMERLKRENRAMRDLIKATHKARTPECRCWVCFPPQD